MRNIVVSILVLVLLPGSLCAGWYGEGEGEKEKSELNYFDRTGDFTVSLKFENVFNDLLDAVGAHLPVDFARQLYQSMQGGVSAAELPLKFRFNFTLFEGQSYAVPAFLTAS